jgi:hypothetical protein
MDPPASVNTLAAAIPDARATARAVVPVVIDGAFRSLLGR